MSDEAAPTPEWSGTGLNTCDAILAGDNDTANAATAPIAIPVRRRSSRGDDFIVWEVVTLLLVATAVTLWSVRIEEPLMSGSRPLALTVESEAGADGSRSTFFVRRSSAAQWDAENATWQLPFADDQTLIHLEHKAEMVALLIDRAAVTDAGLRALVKCPRLEHLRMRHAPIRDSGVEMLCQLPRLRMLNLPHAVFTDNALQRLAALPNLEMLRFGSPHVTDEGIAALAAAPRLRFLHIIDSPIGDWAIAELAGCATLESLYIDGGRFDDQSVVRLLERRPGLHVHLNQQHHDRDPLRLTHGPHVPVGDPAEW